MVVNEAYPRDGALAHFPQYHDKTCAPSKAIYKSLASAAEQLRTSVRLLSISGLPDCHAAPAPTPPHPGGFPLVMAIIPAPPVPTIAHLTTARPPLGGGGGVQHWLSANYCRLPPTHCPSPATRCRRCAKQCPSPADKPTFCKNKARNARSDAEHPGDGCASTDKPALRGRRMPVLEGLGRHCHRSILRTPTMKTCGHQHSYEPARGPKTGPLGGQQLLVKNGCPSPF